VINREEKCDKEKIKKKLKLLYLFWVVVYKVEKGLLEFQLNMDAMSIHI